MYGTGHDITVDIEIHKFLGTVKIMNDSLMFHFFIESYNNPLARTWAAQIPRYRVAITPAAGTTRISLWKGSLVGIYGY